MIVSSASPDVRIVSAKSRCSSSSGVSSSRPLMPMIAFIGVRISWLIAGEERALGLVRLLGRPRRASWASANSRALSIAMAACCERPTRKLEVGRREGLIAPRAPDGHHAGHLAADRAAARPSAAPRRPGRARMMARARGSDVVDHSRPSRHGDVADDPLAAVDRGRLDLLGDLADATSARKISPSSLGQEHGAGVGLEHRPRAIRDRLEQASRSSVAEISRPTSASAAISRAPRVSSYSRAFWIATPIFAAIVGEEALVGFAEAALLVDALDADDADRASPPRSARRARNGTRPPPLPERLPVLGAIQQQRLGALEDLRGQALADRHRVLGPVLAVLGVIRELDEPTLLVDERDVDDVALEGGRRLLADELESGSRSSCRVSLADRR